MPNKLRTLVKIFSLASATTDFLPVDFTGVLVQVSLSASNITQLSNASANGYFAMTQDPNTDAAIIARVDYGTAVVTAVGIGYGVTQGGNIVLPVKIPVRPGDRFWFVTTSAPDWAVALLVFEIGP